MSEKKNQKKQPIKILQGILILVILASGFYIVKYVVDQNHAAKLRKELQESANLNPVTTLLPAEETPNPEVPVDFATLQETNPDIYAWIEIPETDLSDPILQSSNGDENYYLNTTVDGQTGLPGALYTQPTYSDQKFSGFNNVIYGHDMRNHTMFGTLIDYMGDEDYLKSHNQILIYTTTQVLTYRIYASVVYDDSLIPYKYDFSTKQGCQDFITSIQNSTDPRSVYDSEIVLTPEDHLVTLSTCIYPETDTRQLVIGVLEGDIN